MQELPNAIELAERSTDEYVTICGMLMSKALFASKGGSVLATLFINFGIGLLGMFVSLLMPLFILKSLGFLEWLYLAAALVTATSTMLSEASTIPAPSGMTLVDVARVRSLTSQLTATCASPHTGFIRI